MNYIYCILYCKSSVILKRAPPAEVVSQKPHPTVLARVNYVDKLWRRNQVTIPVHCFILSEMMEMNRILYTSSRAYYNTIYVLRLYKVFTTKKLYQTRRVKTIHWFMVLVLYLAIMNPNSNPYLSTDDAMVRRLLVLFCFVLFCISWTKMITHFKFQQSIELSYL